MPALYSRKQYVENGIYHVYNRGVEKRLIFYEKKDYLVFMNILKECLLPKDTLLSELFYRRADPLRLVACKKMKSYTDSIKLLAFVLMPNHFHLQIQQKQEHTLEKFMKSLQIRYVMYFNNKYNRSGSLFQGRYRGILTRNENYLLTVSRYIHRNPMKLLTSNAALSQYPYSSYSTYVGGKKFQWVDYYPVLSMFDPVAMGLARQKYLDFVEFEKGPDP